MNRKIGLFIFLLLFCAFIFSVGCEEELKYSIDIKDNRIVIVEDTLLDIEYDAIEYKDITFSFTNENVAFISSGVIKPTNPGITTLIASYGDVSDSVEVVVFPKLPEAMRIGEKVEFEKNCSYKSSNREVVDITTNGMVANSSGECQITVTLNDDQNLSYAYTISVEFEKPIFSSDSCEISVGEEVFVGLTNYNNAEALWTLSDDSVLELYEDFYVHAYKEGTCIVTAKVGNVESSITIEVIKKAPQILMADKEMIIDEQLEINLQKEYTFDEIDIEVDREYIEVINNNGVYLKGLKAGITEVVVRSKKHPQLFDKVTITIYEKTPFFAISDCQITLNDKIKLDIVNYDDGYIIEIDNENILKYEEGIITAIGVGESTVKVYLENDKADFSSIKISVLPIMPKLSAVLPNVAVGNETGFIITNLSELSDTDINNYQFSIDNQKVAKLENGLLKALSVGQAIVTVTLKSNPIVTSQTTVNVCENNKNSLLVEIKEPSGVLQAGEMYDSVMTNGSKLSDYIWSTSNDLVAIVNDNGRIIAVNAGVCTINFYEKNNTKNKSAITINVVGVPNVNYIDRLIKIAADEIGYVEGSNNYTKYGAWYGLPNEAWCAMFVSWCAKESGISTEIIPKYCGCVAGSKWFIERDRFGYKESYTPKPGDIVFFLSAGAGHTGIVIACDGNKVYTIEGNTSNMVAKRSYDLDYKTITGYGIPDYPAFDGNVEGGDIGGATGGEGESTT